MAINVIAAKRGWLYDLPNATLNAYVDGAKVLALSANTTTGTASLGVSMTFTATTAISHAALEGIVVYTPSTAGSGGAVPLGVRARVTLSEGCTSTLYMYATQTQLHLENTAVLNGSMFSALRAVTTSDASPTFTGGTFAVIYVDQLIQQDMTGLDGNASMIRLANNGGGSANMDTVFDVACPETTNLFMFGVNNTFVSGTSGTKSGGTLQKITVDLEGTTYYILMSTAPTT